MEVCASVVSLTAGQKQGHPQKQFRAQSLKNVCKILFVGADSLTWQRSLRLLHKDAAWTRRSVCIRGNEEDPYVGLHLLAHDYTLTNQPV